MAETPDNPNAADGGNQFSERLAAARERARGNAQDAQAPAETATQETTASSEQESQSQSGGAVGTGDHEVSQGECISSIAKDAGHFWETLWNDAGNAELKSVRQNPNVLLPGDRVTVPPLRTKQESGETEMRHHFRRRGEPGYFRMKLLEEGEPRANVRYVLEVDGQQREGATDAEGQLSQAIPGNARRGKLILFDEEDQEEREEIMLEFGGLDPTRELRGVVERLTNLGFAAGPAGDVLDDRIRGALRAFQKSVDLPETGEPDEQTRQRLEQEHGS